MSMILADISDHIWELVGGGVALILLVIFLMALPDIVVGYIRIKNM